MNNKKQIIQILVIVGAFAGAFFILYSNGVFGGSTNQAVQVSQGTKSLQPILEYGNTLEFKDAIKPDRYDYYQITLPKVQPQADVGVDVGSLIKPIPVSQ